VSQNFATFTIKADPKSLDAEKLNDLVINSTQQRNTPISVYCVVETRHNISDIIALSTFRVVIQLALDAGTSRSLDQ